mmetsp:Transcript_40397/g.35635  ORF Transcript_40397/g.35635 Transcript_40397/m.35635 type:complete len:526 (-) Transcript_40397:343-1920(-)
MKNLSTSVLLSTTSKANLNESGPSKSSTLSKSTANSRRRINTDGSDDKSSKSKPHPIESTIKSPRDGSTTHIIPLNPSTHQLDRDGKKQRHTKKNDYTKVSLFGVDLSRFPAWMQATLLTMIILLGFIAIGYVEEGFKFEFADFRFGWFMTAVELIIFSIFAMIERSFKSLGKITSAVYLSSASTINLNLPTQNGVDRDQLESESEGLLNQRRSGTEDGGSPSKSHTEEFPNTSHNHPSPIEKEIAAYDSNQSKICLLFKINWFNIVFEKQMPFKYHLMVATAMMCSRALTNIALLLLNYPTQVIFKSMKLISVMIGSIFCLKNEYHQCEKCGAPLLVGSAILFCMGDANDLNFNVLGIVVVLISLIFDAIHANSQQYILQAKTARDTTMELLVYTNLMAGVIAFVISFLMGEINEINYEWLPSQPDDTMNKLLLWFVGRVACLYIGVSAFVVFTKRFGAVFAVTITTIRKILTVGLSYVFYPGKKVFIPMQHGTGAILFVISLILWGYGSVEKKRQNASRPARR